MDDNIQVVEIGEANKTLWDEFVSSATEGNIFQTFEWAEIMEKVGYGQQSTCLAMKEDGKVVAGVVLRTETFKGKVMPFFSSCISREGPIIKDKYIRINPLLKSIDKCFSNRSLVEISLPYYAFSSPYGDSFNNFNYEYTPSCTFLISLADSTEKLWENLSKTCRQNVRLAERKGVYVEILSDEDELRKYYELYLRICQRASLASYTYALFQTLWDYSKKRNNVKIIVAMHGGEIAAGAILLSHKNKIWYWNAVSNAKLRNVSAPTLLLWSIIKEGHEKGFHILDLCGAMCRPDPTHPHYGPDQFKAKFGGKRVELGRYQKCFHATFWGLRNRFVIPVHDFQRYRRPIKH